MARDIDKRIPGMHYISDTPDSAAFLRERCLVVMPGGGKSTAPRTVYRVKYFG